MPWIQLKVNVKETQAEPIGDFLSDNGALSVTFMDAKDTPVYEPKIGSVTLWPDTSVLALFDAEHDMLSVLANMNASELFPEDLKYKLDQLEDKDWEREWMDNFHPMQFGEKLWICPSWCDAPDPNAINIKLDPGLAFGTGTHPTTDLCLQWLDKQDVAGKTIIDFGCGSGILAIAALLLGAKHVIGIDIDPQALLASKDNAERNDVAERLTLYLPEDTPEVDADIVLANILAAPLRELRPLITSMVRNEGSLIMSGVLESQAEEINALYAQDFAMIAPTFLNDWSRLEGRKV